MCANANATASNEALRSTALNTKRCIRAVRMRRTLATISATLTLR
jgi:hypothetical protein